MNNKGIIIFFCLSIINSPYVLANNKVYYKGQIGFNSNFKTKSNELFYKYSKNQPIKIPLIYQFGLGYYLTSNIRAELIYTQLKGNYNFSKNDYTPILFQDHTTGDIITSIPGTTTYIYKQNLLARGAMIHLYYDLLPDKAIQPYLGIGVGYTIVTHKNTNFYNNKKYDLTDYNSITNYYYPPRKSKNLSYSLMSGIAIKIHKNVTFDIEYKFHYLGKNPGFNEIHIRKNTSPVVKKGKNPSSFRLNAHIISAGLRFSF